MPYQRAKLLIHLWLEKWYDQTTPSGLKLTFQLQLLNLLCTQMTGRIDRYLSCYISIHPPSHLRFHNFMVVEAGIWTRHEFIQEVSVNQLLETLWRMKDLFLGRRHIHRR